MSAYRVQVMHRFYPSFCFLH